MSTNPNKKIGIQAREGFIPFRLHGHHFKKRDPKLAQTPDSQHVPPPGFKAPRVPTAAVTSGSAKPPRPTLLQMAGRFGKALAIWTAKGFPMVPDDELKKRSEICGACEYWTGTGCQVCGCKSQKLLMATESCPLQKWKAIK